MKNFYALLVSVLIISSNAFSQTLATWSNTNANTPMTLASSATGVNAASTSLTRAGGLSYLSSTTRYNSNNWHLSSNYLTITVTAAAGYTLNLNSGKVTLNMGSSGTGPGSYTLRSSVDNYATVIATITTGCGSGVQSGNIDYNLPSSGYDGLSAITFRVIGGSVNCNAGATANTGTGGPSAASVSGTVVAPLPVKLISFQAKKINGKVKLLWSTATEINNSHFNVERSVDGEEFKSISSVYGAGNSNSIINYEVTDINPAKATNYYRLKQTDFDGAYSYSDVVAVTMKNQGFEVSKVYVDEQQVRFTVQAEDDHTITAELFDIAGRRIVKETFSVEQGYSEHALEKQNRAGIYIVRVYSTEGDLNQTFKVKL